MADYRAARDADLFVVSARTDLRWTEWLVLCFSTDGCGVDAVTSPVGGEAAKLTLRRKTTGPRDHGTTGRLNYKTMDKGPQDNQTIKT